MTQTLRKMLLGSLPIFCLLFLQNGLCSAQSISELEQITQFLENAQSSFDKQEFSASFELYQRVLMLEPGNQIAREKIFGIASMYKSLEEVARRDGELGKAEILQQQQKDITRYLLNVFTSELESSIKNYRAQKTAEKEGEDVKEGILPILETIIGALTDLKGLYEAVSGDEERTKQMIERIEKTLQRYEKELDYYRGLQ